MSLIAAGTAIVSGGIALGKNIAARVKKKKALGAGAAQVDPNQAALKNALKRKQRSLELGSSQGRLEGAKDRKNLLRSSILAGRRNLSDVSAQTNQIETNIAKEEGAIGAGVSEALQKQTQDVSDRKMDEQDKAQSQALLDAATLKSSSGKNLNAMIPPIGDAVEDAAANKASTPGGEGADGLKKTIDEVKSLYDGLKKKKQVGKIGKMGKALNKEFGGVLGAISKK